jgi:Ca-activated chloride channel family protein
MDYFAYPNMFGWLVVPIAVWAASWWATRYRRKAIERLGQPATINRLLSPGLVRRRRWLTFLRVSGLLCMVLALAGPLIGARLVEFKQRGLDVFIAVDCSLSMQAEDLKPNRMAQAKLILGQLIDRLPGSRIGIIAFAGQAYIQCPMTIDAGAAKEVLEAIDVGSVPIPGTVIGDAIRTAIKGFRAGEGGGRVLVLLTDGEDHKSDPIAAAKDAAKMGLKIYTVGIGNPAQGEPIPMFDENGRRIGYKNDSKGQPVLSRLDESLLIQLAQDTGGQYFRATPTGNEVDQLANALESLEHGDQRTRLFNRFENRFQWPLALGLILLIMSLAVPEQRWKW